MLFGSTTYEILPDKRNNSRISFRPRLDRSEGLSLFHICVPQERGPPLFVFLACDLSGGISPFEELQGRLHFAVSGSAHRRHERQEEHPKEYPDNPPDPVHSTKIVVHRLTPKYAVFGFAAGARKLGNVFTG